MRRAKITFSFKALTFQTAQSRVIEQQLRESDYCHPSEKQLLILKRVRQKWNLFHLRLKSSEEREKWRCHERWNAILKRELLCTTLPPFVIEWFFKSTIKCIQDDCKGVKLFLKVFRRVENLKVCELQGCLTFLKKIIGLQFVVRSLYAKSAIFVQKVEYFGKMSKNFCNKSKLSTFVFYA